MSNEYLYETSEVPEYVLAVKELVPVAKTRNDWLDFQAEVCQMMIADYADIDLIHLDSEVIVVGDPQTDERAISYEHTKPEASESISPLYLLERYHLHSMLNILYPEHFVRIYGVDINSGMFIRQRVYERVHFSSQDIYRVENSGLSIEKKVFQTIRVKLLLALNMSSFVEDQDGCVKYVDLVGDKLSELNIDPNKVLAYFDKIYPADADTPNDRSIETKRKKLIWNLKRMNELVFVERISRMVRRFGHEYLDSMDPEVALNGFSEKQRARILRTVKTLNGVI